MGRQLTCCYFDEWVLNWNLVPSGASQVPRLRVLPPWALVTGSITCLVPAPQAPGLLPVSLGLLILPPSCCHMCCTSCRYHICCQPGLPFLAAASGPALHSAPLPAACPRPVPGPSVTSEMRQGVLTAMESLFSSVLVPKAVSQISTNLVP